MPFGSKYMQLSCYPCLLLNFGLICSVLKTIPLSSAMLYPRCAVYHQILSLDFSLSFGVPVEF